MIAFGDELARLVGDFQARHSPNEAETERDLIEPVLRLLGWLDFLPQQTAAKKGRSDVPDYLLFASAASKTSAGPVPASEKYKFGASILEAKAWELSLDKPNGREGTPSTQLLRYLGRVEIESDGSIRFGVLSNGRVWRLYDHKARTSRLEAFVEIDLFEALGLVVPAEKRTGGDPHRATHLLRLFRWLFGRDAFEPLPSGRTRLEQAIADSRSFEARVTNELADTVFDRVFPDLADALSKADPHRPAKLDTAYLGELREAALTWLYRLLFVFYAEDRDLIPTRRWRGGLRSMREDVARALDRNESLSSFPEYDSDLRRMWRQIDEGDEGLRLPPYNGGLFKHGRSPLLDRSLIPDSAFAPFLDALSRERTGASPRLINYRDLNVQHLGSVYERFLEFDLIEDRERIVARPQAFARKTSGSYYTPEDLVSLVLRRAVGPLLEERRATFAKASDRLRSDRRSTEERARELRAVDPASKFLELKICDPAMGSGHFLVSLVDYLADEVMKATEEAATVAEWCEYESPLLERLASIRERIEAEAKEHGWEVHSEQLVDRQLVRRIILKRVVHGVDKNPMAVELAKLSLWLHTFTVGAPLSFLDHHLRRGDSLFGEWVRPALDRFAEVGLFKGQAVKQAELAIGEMQQIEELTDADIAEVRRSAETYEMMKSDTAELRQLLDVLQGFRWIGQSTEQALKDARKLRNEADRLALSDPKASALKDAQAAKLRRRAMALEALLQEEFGAPSAAIDLCYGRIGDPDPAKAEIAQAIAVAKETKFLHWQVAFPGVWRNWESREVAGGFDAVVGNPPWDKLRFEEVPWFAARNPEIAFAPRSSDRKRMIEELKTAGDSLADDYDKASRIAGMAARVATLPSKKGGQFPLLGRGDVNLYSLFVERASQLVKPNGIVGFLVPSGIASDLGASEFFKSISTSGRLAALLDFQNRPATGHSHFFEDVDSRFKFCVLCYGGANRNFGAAECGFFLTTTDDDALTDQTFPLTPADFDTVNPNTGTAPLFRTARDADLTTGVYSRVPVLIDHRVKPPRARWRVEYANPFHMAGDSALFKTGAELEASGYYPVSYNRYRKGGADYVALYEGKMVQAFDHRAANVIVNPENLHRPGQPLPATFEQHTNPEWVPTPQFYVPEAKVLTTEWSLALKDITSSTNQRTVIASIIPMGSTGHTLPLLDTRDHLTKVILLSNLNAFALDYVARQKVQATHIMWYIIEQLPILPPETYDQRFGNITAREIVTREVLYLTYSANDLANFARDMGYVDSNDDVLPSFPWNETERRQRRARLDALFFHLYGIGKQDADYILSTFPIVQRHDEAEFGRYLTRDLIIHHMDALSAGDTEAVIAI